MRKYGKKLAAPILISALIVLYFIGYVVVIAVTDWLPLGWAIVASVVPLCLAGVMIYVLLQRIKEIRSGEEDDLSQY